MFNLTVTHGKRQHNRNCYIPFTARRIIGNTNIKNANISCVQLALLYWIVQLNECLPFLHAWRQLIYYVLIYHHVSLWLPIHDTCHLKNTYKYYTTAIFWWTPMQWINGHICQVRFRYDFLLKLLSHDGRLNNWNSCRVDKNR